MKVKAKKQRKWWVIPLVLLVIAGAVFGYHQCYGDGAG
jgi:hypothetical protein